MTRYAMAVDLRRCVGCQTCTAACKEANATPPGVQWRRVLDIESGEFPDVRRDFLPVGCMHCSNAPCADVCPTTATRRRADGVVTIDYELCIGCANCVMACPYDARSIVHEAEFAYGWEPMPNESARFDPSRLGVATKCTFCRDRLDAAARTGQVPGRDPEVTPACVNSCIAGALVFGDQDDARSPVNRLLAETKHFRMHEEIGTDPGVYYVWDRSDAPPRRSAPALQSASPAHQRYWDWRAAGNFIGGGSGGALLFAAALASLAGAGVSALMLAGVALIAAGLAFVWFEIGRPWRALNVYRNLRTSWMSREALLAPFVLGAGALAAFSDDMGFAVSAGALGALYLYCQGRMLTADKGITAWRAPGCLSLMLATGLTEGAGLLAVAASILPQQVAAAAALSLIALLGARAWLWKRYLAGLQAAPQPTRLALAALDRPFVLLGQLLPAVLAVAAMLAAPAAASLLIAAGLFAAAAGWLMKYALVTRAAFIEPLTLAAHPARGGGSPGPVAKLDRGRAREEVRIREAATV